MANIKRTTTSTRFDSLTRKEKPNRFAQSFAEISEKDIPLPEETSAPVESKVNVNIETVPSDKPASKKKEKPAAVEAGVTEKKNSDLITIVKARRQKNTGVSKCVYFDRDVYEGIEKIASQFPGNRGFSNAVNVLLAYALEEYKE